jgi:hypothetical protein
MGTKVVQGAQGDSGERAFHNTLLKMARKREKSPRKQGGRNGNNKKIQKRKISRIVFVGANRVAADAYDTAAR